MFYKISFSFLCCKNDLFEAKTYFNFSILSYSIHFSWKGFHWVNFYAATLKTFCHWALDSSLSNKMTQLLSFHKGKKAITLHVSTSLLKIKLRRWSFPSHWGKKRKGELTMEHFASNILSNIHTQFFFQLHWTPSVWKQSINCFCFQQLWCCLIFHYTAVPLVSTMDSPECFISQNKW